MVYSGITLVFKFQAVWTTSYHTQFRFIRTKYQGEFSLVEEFVFEVKKGAETLLSHLAPQKVSSLLLFNTYLVM
jgi:hypothetical protein